MKRNRDLLLENPAEPDHKERDVYLSVDKDAAFEKIFKFFFRELHEYSFSIIRDWDMAEEVVQALFLKLWENDTWTHVEVSMRSFLYRSVYHESLNIIRHNKVRLKYENRTSYTMKDDITHTTSPVELNELEDRIHKSLNRLPEKCRTIFQLSRFGELTYRQVAMQLGISVKTVETQMGKALRILRNDLKDYLSNIEYYEKH